MTEPLRDKDWNHLTLALRRGRCVLVLGPEAVQSSTVDADQMPLSAEFAAELAHGSDRAVFQESPFEAAQRWQDRGGRRYELEDRAVDFYEKYKDQTDSLHIALAQLPFRVYLTVNHDRFLANAFSKAADRTPQYAHYHFREMARSDLVEPSVERPIVYGLYGAATDPSSMVLSESDLLLFLESVVTGSPPLPPLIEGLLRREENAFLFLGFGFQQWHVRLLLHTLLGPERYQRRDRHRPSLVLESEGFYQHPDSNRTIAFFESQHTFMFREFSTTGFATELVRRCGNEEAAAEETALPENAPLVFLSYRHQDRDLVDDLRKQLRSAGIDTWQDSHNLRGGERWPQAIEKVIGKECDYFVVCQTPSLVRVRESVVFEEINHALARDRRRNIDGTGSFIIPVILQPCDGLEQLKSDFHTLDLTAQEGIEKLVRTILDDSRRHHSDQDAA